MDELIIYETQDGQNKLWDLKSKINDDDLFNIVSFAYINQKRKDDNGLSYQEVHRYGIPYLVFGVMYDSRKWDSQEDFVLTSLAVKPEKKEDINACFCPFKKTSYQVTDNVKVYANQRELIKQMISKGYVTSNTDEYIENYTYTNSEFNKLYYKIISDLYALKTNLETNELETHNAENQKSKVDYIKMLITTIDDLSLYPYVRKIYKLCNYNAEKVRRSIMVILFGEISIEDVEQNLKVENPIPFVDDDIFFEDVPDCNIFYIPTNTDVWNEYIQKQKEKFYEKFTIKPSLKK